MGFEHHMKPVIGVHDEVEVALDAAEATQARESLHRSTAPVRIPVDAVDLRVPTGPTVGLSLPGKRSDHGVDEGSARVWLRPQFDLLDDRADRVIRELMALFPDVVRRRG
jgi:hypothetical protein